MFVITDEMLENEPRLPDRTLVAFETFLANCYWRSLLTGDDPDNLIRHDIAQLKRQGKVVEVGPPTDGSGGE